MTAGIGLAHGTPVVTRSVADFSRCGIALEIPETRHELDS
jgi:hypothetical protein